jgi:hypothetical protein
MIRVKKMMLTAYTYQKTIGGTFQSGMEDVSSSLASKER